MELSELKNIFDAGELKSAIVIPATLEDGYCIIVTDTKRASHATGSYPAFIQKYE